MCNNHDHALIARADNCTTMTHTVCDCFSFPLVVRFSSPVCVPYPPALHLSLQPFPSSSAFGFSSPSAPSLSLLFFHFPHTCCSTSLLLHLIPLLVVGVYSVCAHTCLRQLVLCYHPVFLTLLFSVSSSVCCMLSTFFFARQLVKLAFFSLILTGYLQVKFKTFVRPF